MKVPAPVEVAVVDDVRFTLGARRAGFEARCVDPYLEPVWLDDAVRTACAQPPVRGWAVHVEQGLCAVEVDALFDEHPPLLEALAALQQALVGRARAILSEWQQLGRALDHRVKLPKRLALLALPPLRVAGDPDPVEVRLVRKVDGEGDDDLRLRTKISTPRVGDAPFALVHPKLPAARRPAVSAPPAEPGPPVCGELIAWAGDRAQIADLAAGLTDATLDAGAEEVIAVGATVDVLLPGMVTDVARLRAAAALATSLARPASTAQGPYR